MGEKCPLYTDILNSYNNSVMLPLTRPAQKPLSWHGAFFSKKFASVPGKNISCPLLFWFAFDADTGNTN